jgi:hypothetical protein
VHLVQPLLEATGIQANLPNAGKERKVTNAQGSLTGQPRKHSSKVVCSASPCNLNSSLLSLFKGFARAWESFSSKPRQDKEEKSGHRSLHNDNQSLPTRRKTTP